MEEIWKDIPSYEGMYQVSSFGRIRSLSRNLMYVRHCSTKSCEVVYHLNGKILKQTASNGYLCVTLNKNGRSRYKAVHKLVALMFVPNPENKPVVDHVDGNRSNNHFENLRWVTAKERNINAVVRGELVRRSHGHQSIRDIDTLEVFHDIEDIVVRYGISQADIQYSISTQNQVDGHRFELVERKHKSLFK